MQHCDANFFEDLEVFVVGGGDSAVEESIVSDKIREKVTIIHRRNELRAAKSIQEKAFANPKIEFFWDSVVEEVGGDDILQWMKVKNVKTGENHNGRSGRKRTVCLGYSVSSEQFQTANRLKVSSIWNERGYIKTDDDMHTNIRAYTLPETYV